MRHILTYKYEMISGSHHYSIQGPKMPKKLKKSTAEKEEVTLEEIVTITHLRKQKAERDMLHERRMERDLTRLLRSWHKDKLPKSVVFGFSASYMVNFIFACCTTPEEANHLLISTIAKQLVISNEIEHSETIIQ
jgi:hypothetical protein